MPAARSRRAFRSSLRRAALAATAVVAGLLAVAAVAWFRLPDPARLARDNPRTTALIEQRRAEARAHRRPFRPRQAWVGLDAVSPRLVEAVVLSEDAGFWGHEGIDWDATWEAAAADWKARRFARGASTVTQQLAKNLWLGTEKSVLRKAKEAVLAVKLERALPKRRILALYLNVAEWGEGVFGVEAGSRARFGTGAAGLSTAQAVVMASMLPAPRRVDLASPSTWLKRRARHLLDRLRDARRIDADEHLHASAELERILAGPVPVDDSAEEPAAEEPAAAGEPAAAVPPSPQGDISSTPTATATPASTSTSTSTATATPIPTPTPEAEPASSVRTAAP